MEQKAIYEKLVEKFGEGALGFLEEGPEPVADIAPQKIAEAALYLRDEAGLEFDQLMCLSGLDWDGFDENGKGKSVAILGYDVGGQPETSDRVGEGDLGVAYHLYSHGQRHKFTMRVRVPRTAPTLPSVAGVWSTAGWHEREAYDLVGITFEGHPDLRRILLEEEWEGHPLRKDYVMPDRWGQVPLDGKNLAKNPFPATEPDPSGSAPAAPTED